MYRLYCLSLFQPSRGYDCGFLWSLSVFRGFCCETRAYSLGSHHFWLGSQYYGHLHWQYHISLMLGRTHLGTTKIPARDPSDSLIAVVEEKMDIRNRPLYRCMSFTFRSRVLCILFCDCAPEPIRWRSTSAVRTNSALPLRLFTGYYRYLTSGMEYIRSGEIFNLIITSWKIWSSDLPLRKRMALVHSKSPSFLDFVSSSASVEIRSESFPPHIDWLWPDVIIALDVDITYASTWLRWSYGIGKISGSPAPKVEGWAGHHQGKPQLQIFPNKRDIWRNNLKFP